MASTDTAQSSETDTLIHRQSLGTVKAGKEKSRTIGGGLINRYETTGMYIIALIDSANQVAESDENNNVLVSDPLP